MPCTTAKNLTPTARQAQLDALKRLETALGTGQASIVISAAGAIAFRNWPQGNAGVSDLCAYRALVAGNSPVLRRALARAEALAGRQISMQALNAGVHSHDGGQTWGAHR